jgi:hypothetical protein
MHFEPGLPLGELRRVCVHAWPCMGSPTCSPSIAPPCSTAQFNGGSALQAGPSAAWAVLTSNLSAASAMLGWMLMDTIFGHEGGVVSLCMGAVVGMVSITPAAGE